MPTRLGLFYCLEIVLMQQLKPKGIKPGKRAYSIPEIVREYQAVPECIFIWQDRDACPQSPSRAYRHARRGGRDAEL